MKLFFFAFESLGRNLEIWHSFKAPASKNHLVGGFDPSEKYINQIESFPQTGVKIQSV